MSCIATPTLKLTTLSCPIAPTFSFSHSQTYFPPHKHSRRKSRREQYSYPSAQKDNSCAMKAERQFELLKWQHNQYSRKSWKHRYFFKIAINSDEFLKFLAIRNLYVISINNLELCLVSQNCINFLW